MISHAELLARLDYDPETGIFRWKPSRGPVLGGQIAGTVERDGNVRISIKGRPQQAGRLAWFYVTGEWPERTVGHRNGDRSDNRFANLRLADATQHRANCSRHRSNKSGYKGVSKVTGYDRWVAYISVDGRRKNLGYFEMAEFAAAAYERAARAIYGEFARIE